MVYGIKMQHIAAAPQKYVTFANEMPIAAEWHDNTRLWWTLWSFCWVTSVLYHAEQAGLRATSWNSLTYPFPVGENCW